MTTKSETVLKIFLFIAYSAMMLYIAIAGPGCYVNVPSHVDTSGTQQVQIAPITINATLALAACETDCGADAQCTKDCIQSMIDELNQLRKSMDKHHD